MSFAERRNPFTFALAARRTADFYTRAGRARMLCLAGVGLTSALGGASWWVWPILGIAFLGAWQGWGLSRAVLADSIPRNPVLLWAYRSAVAGHGRHTVNVPGVLEGVSCISLGLATTYGIHDSTAALAALVLVMMFAVSVFSAVFVDNANYNPNDDPFVGFEWLRQGVGPLLAALAAVTVLPGWPESSRATAALVCSLGILASVRVRETDRAFLFAYQEARESERLAGRDDVLNQTHGLSTDLDRALSYGDALRSEHPEVFEYIQTASVKLHQLSALEDPYADGVDYPDTLSRAVRRYARAYGAWDSSDIRVPLLSDADHQLARILVHDLVGNAAKAGASRISMYFEHVDEDTVQSEDRGRRAAGALGVVDGTWVKSGQNWTHTRDTVGRTYA